MPALGIGGIFFRAQEPASLGAWYREHLDIGAEWTAQAGPVIFAPFEADTDYWAADKQFMINLRVSDLDGLLTRLMSAGIEVRTDPAWNTPETGRFARLYDPEGNAVELWEPPAS